MTLRIGLIGAGRMGTTFAHHLAFTVTDADFAAVADSNVETAKQVAARYGVKNSYGDYRALLDQKDIEAVVIASPTGTHAEVVKAAAEAGKQIFCEKPLALTLKECDEALAAVEKAKVKLQIGFMRRYDPACVAAKQQIDSGAIGTPVMFKSMGRDPKRTSLEFAKRENGGGLILDMGVHDYDLARWLMGSEVERVYSEGGCLVYPELKDVGDIDNAVVNLKFANGAVGNVDLSRNAVYGYDVRTEVIGSKGSLFIGNLQQTPLLVMTPNSIAHDTIPYFMERFVEAYPAEIRDFVRCVMEDRQPQVTGRDGRAAVAIGVAATKSLDEGKPITL
ncbi:MAG: inositol 2-dehydrogenase [Chloroflexi bacterium]|nr:inositol 2-dehydrogenase [Chloroflexota bacterium]MBI5347807.1 inositol 2-dehydrogenase [Chloroflexota bacterium]